MKGFYHRTNEQAWATITAGIVVDPETACWVPSLKPSHADGYRRTSVRGQAIWVHRLSVLISGRQIPEGWHVDHLCLNPACCNPDHLEPVPAAENVRRGYAVSDPSCPKGHVYDASNTLLDKEGHRRCRECVRLHDKSPSVVAYRTRRRSEQIPCAMCSKPVSRGNILRHVTTQHEEAK